MFSNLPLLFITLGGIQLLQIKISNISLQMFVQSVQRAKYFEARRHSTHSSLADLSIMCFNGEKFIGRQTFSTLF